MINLSDWLPGATRSEVRLSPVPAYHRRRRILRHTNRACIGSCCWCWWCRWTRCCEYSPGVAATARHVVQTQY